MQYYLAVDVPTTLDGVTYTPNQILRSTDAGYVVDTAFPEGVELAALSRRPDGQWLLTPAFPVVDEDPEDPIERRDVILYDAVNDIPSIAIDGSTSGIPDYAAIDAVAYDPATGALAVSFDVPVLIGGVEYGPSDIVGYTGVFSMVWSAAAAGIPSYANVDGFDLDSAGNLVMTFDVPVTLGGATFLPGQLVRWDGGSAFSVYAADPSWPAGSRLGGFAFLPAAGAVPDGMGGSTPVRARRRAGGQVELTWGASCAGLDSDFAVYEGTLGGRFDDPAPATCTTAGGTTHTYTPQPGNRYFLVVPRNDVSEGSYGEASGHLQRPPSTSACLPQEIAPVCE
jgi:hypothetical protein